MPNEPSLEEKAKEAEKAIRPGFEDEARKYRRNLYEKYIKAAIPIPYDPKSHLSIKEQDNFPVLAPPNTEEGRKIAQSRGWDCQSPVLVLSIRPNEIICTTKDGIGITLPQATATTTRRYKNPEEGTQYHKNGQ